MTLRALAIRNLQVTGSIIREETIDGILYGVVPVVMLAEGVHQGISAPGVAAPRSLYDVAFFDAVSQQVDAINGNPVTLNHPQTETELVSAQSAEGRNFVIGYLANTKVEDNKLKSEAYINLTLLEVKSPSALAALRAGESMNVSWGGWPEIVNSTGIWNNEEYDEVISNIRFDHLALLPNDQGACSWSDGCGVRAAKNGQPKSKELSMTRLSKVFAALLGKSQQTTQPNPREAYIDSLIANEKSPVTAEDKTFLMGLPDRDLFLVVNEMGQGVVWNKLSDFVNTLDRPPAIINYLEEVFDAYFVYAVVRRDPITYVVEASVLYKRSYTIDEATDSVTVADDAVEVIKKIEYVPVEDPTANINPNKENSVKEELIKNLTTGEKAPFKEEDRPTLQAMSECQLKRLDEALKANAAPPAPTPAATTTAPTAAAEAPKVQTVEDYIKSAPEAVGKALTALLSREKVAKDALIEKITANQGCPFTKEELGAKEFDELQKIAQLAGIKSDPIADYSGQAGSTVAANGPKVPAMPSLIPEAAKK